MRSCVRFRTKRAQRPERERLRLQPGKKPDRRVARTQSLVLGAFHELLLARGYDGFTAGDLIERAGVGRSTFYEHFENKEDVFEHSVAQPLGALADALFAAQPDGARAIVEHFWENRDVGRAMFNGAARLVMERVLARLIVERLERRRRAALPMSLVGAHLAGGQLGLIAAWVDAGAPCDTATLARALHVAAHAVVEAFF